MYSQVGIARKGQINKKIIFNKLICSNLKGKKMKRIMFLFAIVLVISCLNLNAETETTIETSVTVVRADPGGPAPTNCPFPGIG